MSDIEKIINKAVDQILCIPELNQTSIIQRLFYLCYNECIQYGKLITKNKIVENWIPNFNIADEQDETEDPEDNMRIDSEKIHDILLNKGFLFFPINYDYYYVNTDTDNKAVLFLGVNGIEIFTERDNTELYENIKSFLTVKEKQETKNEVGILVRNSVGYTVSYLQFNKMAIEPEKTYNDDLPIEAISNFITNENTGLCLFYGEPGTGKSTFIKYLIQEYNKKSFVILNSDVLYDTTSGALIKEFIENKNTIYIIEDCEKLLVSRNAEQNSIISAFLNMTDGILAEVISCKFICTFNTSLTNIDEALLRKGRLKLKYEFKKLDKEKVNKIIPELNTDMTVADLFNYKRENDFSKKTNKKIGFIH